jgi:hypothetical protein
MFCVLLVLTPIYICSQNWKKWLLPLSCLSIHLFAQNELDPTGQIFTKFDVWAFFKNPLRIFNFDYNLTRITGTSHENVCTFVVLPGTSHENVCTFVVLPGTSHENVCTFVVLPGTSHENVCTFVVLPGTSHENIHLGYCLAEFFLNEKCFRKVCIENQNTHFVFSNIFLRIALFVRWCGIIWYRLQCDMMHLHSVLGT